MKNEHHHFVQRLRFELLLLALFVVVLGLNMFHLIPMTLETGVLGSVIFIGIIPVARSAWLSLRHKKINVDLLAALALFFSLIAHEWNSALFISLMLASARILGLYTERRVRVSLDSLIKLKPSHARVLRKEGAVVVPLSLIATGDLILVNLGEQIPVDGRIVDGAATIDQSSLTGESLPAFKKTDDYVLSATVVVSGHITVRAEKIGAQTTFERMISLVESSQSAKTRVKTSAEHFASWYISIMLIVAILLYEVTAGDTKLVLAVILVVCADDIAIAVPLAYLAGIGSAARRGIIIKTADLLEQVARITTLVVDKTGTLTMGHLEVSNVQSFGKIGLLRTLEISGIICHHSTHPVARAIIRYAEEKNVACSSTGNFEEIEGRGIRGVVDGKEVILGRIEFLNEQGIHLDDNLIATLREEEERGNNVTIVAYDHEVVGYFALSDLLRPSVPETIAALKKSGVSEVVMLTGDNEGAARNIAAQAGIDTYYAHLLPENKLIALERYLGQGKTVAMVGDGVNDAPVLSRADIGIAMGGIGSDITIDSSDIVLMKDDFSKILELQMIAERVRSVAHENYLIWGIVNILGLCLVFTHIIGPSGAAAYNFLTDFIPIINSLRLFGYKQKSV